MHNIPRWLFFLYLFSISKEKSENVNENLVRLLSAVSKEPSVKGISFQARYELLNST